MSRYEPPDPKCQHVPVNRVTAGDMGGGPHASTYVCDRPACIEDAMGWVHATTLLTGVVVPLPSRS